MSDSEKDYMDLSSLGLTRDLCHSCIGTNQISFHTAKRLEKKGLVFIENSPNGPMITRTHKGSMLVK